MSGATKGASNTERNDRGRQASSKQAEFESFELMKQQLLFYRSIVESLCGFLQLPDPTSLLPTIAKQTMKHDKKIKKLQLELKELRSREKKHAKNHQLV